MTRIDARTDVQPIVIDVIQGADAHAILDDPIFVAEWRNVYAACSHATAFQDVGFVTTWYEVYGAHWQPVIVRGRDHDGATRALWFLAYDKSAAQLAHAGAHQAEYHAWLAEPAAESEFLALAWTYLSGHFDFDRLLFKYLPRAELATRLQGIGNFAPALRVWPRQRPLLNLDAEELRASMAKKSNKSRFNRLKKLGEVEFRAIESAHEFESLIDELALHYDFRQGAVNHTTPFRDDPLKREFYCQLFAAPDARTCVTITSIDGRPVAGFFGSVSGDTAHLGMLIHSPLIAAHSPGKLHVMQLSAHLLDQGFRRLDLTPGGDAWKERFANDHDEVAEACLYRSSAAQRHDLVSERVASLAKRAALAAGSSPAEVRAGVRKLRRLRPATLLRKAREWHGIEREYRVYRQERAQVAARLQDSRVQRDDLASLLQFEPGEAWQTIDDFRSSALSRLESGHHAYTIAIDGRLAHSGWMAVGQRQSYMTEVEQTLHFPPGSVALYDFYTHHDFRGRGLYRATISHMLCDAFEMPAVEYAYISVLADNHASRHVIEALEFGYLGSFHLARHLGSTTTSCSPDFAPPDTNDEEN